MFRYKIIMYYILICYKKLLLISSAMTKLGNLCTRLYLQVYKNIIENSYNWWNMFYPIKNNIYHVITMCVPNLFLYYFELYNNNYNKYIIYH